MNHPSYQRSLAVAGLATMNGSQRAGANRSLRSHRQRRKAFEKDARPIIKSFEREHPDFTKPKTMDEREALRLQHDEFADFCNKLDRLAAYWGV